MYGQGGKVLGACTGIAAACAGATVLPQTGMNAAIQLAIAAAAGLVAWAAVYMASTKFGSR
jgi:LPXTG-motif cell wall-anchored protein